jgi:4-amino-4-deoxy-L-arabinose transferase-like glycosyltransferase
MGSSTGLSFDRMPWIWILVAAGALLYIPFIGGVSLFDWDEINFAEISREMIMTGDYLNIQVNYQPFFEKPPFFFWLQVLCMKTFGINEFAARLPNALGGIITLVFLYKTGSRWIDRRFGVFWALSYMGSILPTLYHKSGIIDPWFNLFIFSGIVAWVEGSRAQRNAYRWYLISGLLSGMAVLTKGPVGPLLIGLTVLVMRLWSKDKAYLSIKSVLLFIAGNCMIAGIWFSINWMTNGPELILAFIKYQAELLTKSVAGHKGFPGYHFVVLLFGVFPASLIALGGFHRKKEDEPIESYKLRLLMMIIVAVVVVLFSIVQSKIVHYSSMAYYPLGFLSAWVVCRYLDGKYQWKGWQVTISVFVALVVVLAMGLLPFAGQHMDWLKSTFTFDAYTRATLDAQVTWGMADYIPLVWILLVLALFIYLLKTSKPDYAFTSLFAGVGVFVTIALIFFIGKIERYSQHAAVEFCETYAGQQVDIRTLRFKSYLPFFYAKKPVPDPTLKTEEIPHYYILKVNKRKRLEEMPELEIMYEKNGFIFLKEK